METNWTQDFFKWWFGHYDKLVLRCEYPKTLEEAAQLAWQSQAEVIEIQKKTIKDLEARVKLLTEECHWLNSVGPTK